jgi:hypothetical protein
MLAAASRNCQISSAGGPGPNIWRFRRMAFAAAAIDYSVEFTEGPANFKTSSQGGYLPTTSTVNEPGTMPGRGRGFSVVAPGGGVNSAVTR